MAELPKVRLRLSPDRQPYHKVRLETGIVLEYLIEGDLGATPCVWCIVPRAQAPGLSYSFRYSGPRSGSGGTQISSGGFGWDKMPWSQWALLTTWHWDIILAYTGPELKELGRIEINLHPGAKVALALQPEQPLYTRKDLTETGIAIASEIDGSLEDRMRYVWTFVPAGSAPVPNRHILRYAGPRSGPTTTRLGPEIPDWSQVPWSDWGALSGFHWDIVLARRNPDAYLLELARIGLKLQRSVLEAPVLQRVDSAADGLSLEWTAVAGAERYAVEISSDEPGKEPLRAEVTGQSHRFERPALDASYRAKVQARAGSETGPWSQPVAVLVESPQGLTLSSRDYRPGDRELRLLARWRAGRPDAGYLVELLRNQVPVAQQSATEPELLFSAQPAGGRYTCQVRLKVGPSAGPWSPAASGPWLGLLTPAYDDRGQLSRLDADAQRLSFESDAFGNITRLSRTALPVGGPP